MDIASIQKRKFLNNIYKLLYSNGVQPKENDILKLFNNYFSVNKLGKPIDINYSLLQNTDLTNVDILNELMANSLLNLEVLYDCVSENNNGLFKVITALNAKVENLKSKRKFLEGKIDDLLFSNSNSDGFFYSYLENFSNTQKIDLNLTNSYVDTLNGVVKIPKITSSIANALSVDSIIPATATYSLYANGNPVQNGININNIDVLFDGLNDTYWSHDFHTDTLSVVSLELEMPLNTFLNISKIEGSLLTSSPCALQVSMVPADISKPVEIRSKNSKNDYNNFSFLFPSGNYASVKLVIYKTEPDSIVSNTNNCYLYSFGIRDLIIGADYHDIRSTLVSTPISIPTKDNSSLSISSVAIDVQDQILSGTSATYYVAADNPNAKSINDFNWQIISSWSSVNNSSKKIINLSENNFQTKYISNLIGDLQFIPLNSNAKNINELNPAQMPYSDNIVYRICKVDQNQSYIDPYILSNLNCFKFYNKIISSESDVNLYKSLDSWREEINSISNPTLDKTILYNQTGLVDIPIQYPSIGLLEGKIICEKDNNVTHSVVKSSSNFNLAVYLNGINIADLPAGTLSKNIEWNFVKGINNITITYDKNSSGSIFFNLLSGKSIVDYGMLFLEYYRYLDPIEFRRNANEYINVFTIANFYGSNEVLASNNLYVGNASSTAEVSTKSMLRYYSKSQSDVNAVRYRVDLNRYSNPLQTPVLDAIRIKFKHNNS